MRPTTIAATLLLLAFPVGLAGQGELPQPPRHPAGIDDATHTAIERGLEWLVQNQASDGSWRNAGGYGSYPTAMTGLAGMALLASGSTSTRGRYWRNVRSAVDYLLGKADASTGLIGTGEDESYSMYGHGFATLFLASVYGMEEDVRKQGRLKGVLDRAVGLICAAQSPAGGWIYQPTGVGDEGSVTVTQVQALRACWKAGIVVDKRTIDKAVDYIKRCQNEDGGICYRLSMRGSESRPAITAAGVAVLYNAGVYDDQPFVERAVRFTKQALKVRVDTTHHHFYAHHYWSQALYQRGGEDWDEHFAELAPYLREKQRGDGSWQGDGVGPVYGTALALTMLQLPYALLPIYQR